MYFVVLFCLFLYFLVFASRLLIFLYLIVTPCSSLSFLSFLSYIFYILKNVFLCFVTSSCFISSFLTFSRPFLSVCRCSLTFRASFYRYFPFIYILPIVFLAWLFLFLRVFSCFSLPFIIIFLYLLPFCYFFHLSFRIFRSGFCLPLLTSTHLFFSLLIFLLSLPFYVFSFHFATSQRS